YDVDGIHIDDYFYPYPEKDSAGATIDFPDEPSWTRYRAGGGRLARDDWRRENVNTLVRRLDHEIHRAKPWVKFGISPFGIWRPGNPPQIVTGFDQYAMLYADARKWLREGCEAR
ncbi:Glycosyl hydrolase-like 10, partial [bacterium JGI 053]